MVCEEGRREVVTISISPMFVVTVDCGRLWSDCVSFL